MSGGSMDYLYLKIEDARFELNTPERVAFRKHLYKVANALREIEWVDSGDSGPEDEEKLIRACLNSTDVLNTLVDEAKVLITQLQREIDYTER